MKKETSKIAQANNAIIKKNMQFFLSKSIENEAKTEIILHFGRIVYFLLER